ncbi:MAG TPA: enoyl-CoA hydratase [Bryobacteraceae bacterium]|jgi:enoyl-CoA hydratase/carnithine racemase|nr:enoyl-CoA hydratase [Bryobacteraceae bacterium]
MENKILVSADGAIGTLTFNNPQRHNAVSFDMWQRATEVLEELAGDAKVRIVVLTGAGGKSFVSGADISKFESERASADAVATYNAATERFSQTLRDYPKPTIAMIRGYCIGGGLGIAVSCDLRIANEVSRFAIPAAKLGLGYGFENIRRLLDLVGPQFVNEILFTARQFDAEEARHMRLINRIVPDGEIEDYVRNIADTIAGNAPLTIRSVKATVRELLRDPEGRDAARCEALVKQCFESADYQEGRRAFLEKRKAVFSGK